jgi:long-chain fatty acid transport protein
VGVAVKPFDDLTIEADYIWTEWSSFKSMVYEFSDKTVGNINEITANEVTSVKQYDDATRIQIGAEYLVDENWTLRMGYVFDESPQNDDYTDYMLPSSDRHIVSTGVGYSWGPWTTDLSLMYLWAKDRDIDNSLVDNTEIINCTTWLGGLSVGYKF